MWPFTLLVLLSVAHCFINVLSCVLCLPLPRRSGAGGSQTFRKSRSYRMEMHDSSKHTEVMHARGASVNRPCAYLCLLVFWCHYFVYAHVFFSALECSLLLYALVFYCMLVGSVGCQILKPPSTGICESRNQNYYCSRHLDFLQCETCKLCLYSGSKNGMTSSRRIMFQAICLCTPLGILDLILLLPFAYYVYIACKEINF